MTQILEPIVFFGSGPVAAASLKLLAKDFSIEAVVTKPRPPHHRGEVPVIATAESLNLPLKTVANKAELNALVETAPFKSRLGILIDFGIIVSQKVIDYFPLGIVNSHFSILPEWRGADPITFSILSGQKQTGVSLMLLVEAMDEGPLLGYGEYTLPPDTTTPELTKDLISLSHSLLLRDIPHYIKNSKTTPQAVTGRKASYSRKLAKEDGNIDWHKPAAQIEREIRAYAEWPKSYTKIQNLPIVITRAHVTTEQGKTGTFTASSNSLVFHCGKDSLVIDQIKPSGKKEMPIRAFLAGYRSHIS